MWPGELALANLRACRKKDVIVASESDVNIALQSWGPLVGILTAVNIFTQAAV